MSLNNIGHHSSTYHRCCWSNLFMSVFLTLSARKVSSHVFISPLILNIDWQAQAPACCRAQKCILLFLSICSYLAFEIYTRTYGYRHQNTLLLSQKIYYIIYLHTIWRNTQAKMAWCWLGLWNTIMNVYAQVSRELSAVLGGLGLCALYNGALPWRSSNITCA